MCHVLLSFDRLGGACRSCVAAATAPSQEGGLGAIGVLLKVVAALQVLGAGVSRQKLLRSLLQLFLQGLLQKLRR